MNERSIGEPTWMRRSAEVLIQSFNFRYFLNLVARGKEDPMRRGFALLASVTALGLLSPTAFGQYPYPYGPMPYPQPYGYPMPVPAYGPNPMMVRPMAYSPAPMPMWQAPPANNTKVFVYGPLTDETVVVATPNPLRAAAYPPAPKADAGASSVSQAQLALTRGGHGTLPTYSKADLPPEACGTGCNEGACGLACDRPAYEPPMRGRGHFIGEVGASFLVPFATSRLAYNTIVAGVPTSTDFPRQVDTGVGASFGYLFHTGWGVRGEYDYLRGSISTSVNSAVPGTTIIAGPIVSPSLALQAGVGVDQFSFTQRLEMHSTNIELLKETCLLDTTLLFSVGGRFTQMTQGYSALRTNPGGVSPAAAIAFDRESFDSGNRFQGWGPTMSFEAVRPLGCGFSLYGNLRGSFLWGTDRFDQDYGSQVTSVNGGVPGTTVVQTSSTAFDTRVVSILETEAGVQMGHRFGRCYVFARVGGVYQYWWDVGNPTRANGNLSFIGGAAKLGITF
jgi:hypothetical protein